MTPRTFLWSLALVTMGVLFLLGVRAALLLQTEHGAAFPPYSSLRSDPLGARALYEALSHLPGITVAQNTRELRFLKADADTTLFVLGVNESPDEVKNLQTIESFVAEGGRLVVAYAIRGGMDFFCLSEEEAAEIQNEQQDGEAKIRRWLNEKDVPALAPRDEIEENELIPPNYALASERWGFRVVAPMDAYEFADSEELFTDTEPGYMFAESMPWKSPEYFLPIHPAWHTIYAAGEDAHPVMMHRNYGKGQIIVASDSYLFSNEAMRNDRQPALLAWLLGNTHKIVFEETTKGISHEPGLMAMMRRYRLHGLIATAALVALLVAWRGSVSLLPRRTEAQERERALILQGRDAHAGLATLLRSATPGAEVLQACHGEWERTFGRTARIAPQYRQSAEELLTQKLENTTALGADAEILHRYLAAENLLREKHALVRERSAVS